MREFATPRARAGALSFPAKVLYTAFGVLTLLGLVTASALYSAVVGFSARATPRELYDNVIRYYQEGRPVVGEPDALRQLLEVAHFHLFSMPVLLLILGHLLLLTDLSERAKLGLILGSVSAVFVHLAAPWGVYMFGAAAAWLYPISGAALLVTHALLIVLPIVQMWTRARQSS